MSQYQRIEYFCDKCGSKLPTFMNQMVIVTDVGQHSSSWSRLHVIIEHHHGSHNNGKTEKADLCQKCAITLLEDALQRVKAGERMTAGVEDPKERKWEK